MATAAIAHAQSSPAPLPKTLFGRQPLLWTAVAFAAGIGWSHFSLSSAHWTPPNYKIWASLLVLIFSTLLLHKRTNFAAALALLSFSFLGLAEFQLAASQPVAILPSALDDQEVTVIGWVSRAGLPLFEAAVQRASWQAQQAEIYQQVDLQADSMQTQQGAQRLPLGIRLGVYRPLAADERDDAERIANAEQFHYGQRIQVQGHIRLAQQYGDPGVWSRRQYLLDHGIAAVMSAKPAAIELLPGRSGTVLGRWRAETRASLLHHVLALASDHGPRMISISRIDTALLAAMILGERSLLDQAIKTDFQRTGAYHLLVVSGMAIAILAFAVFWLARLLRIGEVAATLLSAVFMGLYVSVTDFGAPVQRAALMFAAYLVARLFYRERNELNAVGVAALVVLILQPKTLFDAGFQMTFLAVLAIAGIALPILRRSTQVYRQCLWQLDSTSYDMHLLPKQAQHRLDLRMVISRLSRLVPRIAARGIVVQGMRIGLRITELIFLSLLLQCALALPMAAYFHRATTLSLPSNVVVVPIMGLLLPLALGATLLSYAGAWLAFVPRCATALLLHSVSFTVFRFARFRAADLRVPNPPAWIIAFCLLAFAVAMYCARRRWLIVSTGLLLLVAADLTILFIHHPQIAKGNLEITSIDVGQGDSLLVVTPEGKALLIDGGGIPGGSAGGFDTGEDVVSPYLWSRGFSRLDAVALTHAHDDHIGGLPAVLRNFHPHALWVAPSPATSAYEALLTQSRRQDIPIKLQVAGDQFDFGGAHFMVLAPGPDLPTSTSRSNDESMVLLVSYKGTSALLEGDAEKKTERAISGELGRVDLLKVAHHGSATSTTEELLDAIQPEYAVISVGRFNRYGHPRADVLARLQAAGACTFRTDLNGAWTFYLDGTQLTSARWGEQQQLMRFPNRSHLPPAPAPTAPRCAVSR